MMISSIYFIISFICTRNHLVAKMGSLSNKRLVFRRLEAAIADLEAEIVQNYAEFQRANVFNETRAYLEKTRDHHYAQICAKMAEITVSLKAVLHHDREIAALNTRINLPQIAMQHRKKGGVVMKTLPTPTATVSYRECKMAPRQRFMNSLNDLTQWKNLLDTESSTFGVEGKDGDSSPSVCTSTDDEVPHGSQYFSLDELATSFEEDTEEEDDDDHEPRIVAVLLKKQ